MDVLAIIPARGGSKEIPRKNIKLLAGNPLIAYSIEAAIKSKYVTRVVVSTDDDEIENISKKYNVEVIKRPNELAQDDSPTINAVIHVINYMEKEAYFPDIVILLQPTSPLRTQEDVDNAINYFTKNKDEYDSLVGVCEFDHSPYWSLKIENDYLKPNFGEGYFNKRRQDLPKLFRPNGSLFIAKTESILKFNSFYGKNILPYIMSKEKSIDLDIDMDFKLAEILMEDDHESNKDRK